MVPQRENTRAINLNKAAPSFPYKMLSSVVEHGIRACPVDTKITRQRNATLNHKTLHRIISQVQWSIVPNEPSIVVITTLQPYPSGKMKDYN